LDDHTHYAWTFPLRHKSDVLPTLISFHAFVRTQFQANIMCLQTENGREFDNSASCAFFTKHGIALRLTCPYTSQQNGHTERILRTLNDGVRTLLLQAALPPTFWPDALTASTYLLNRRPCWLRGNLTPFALLFGVAPDYDHLRVFGCLCYPNIASTAPHNSRRAPCAVCSLATPLIRKGTSATTSTANASLSHVTSTSTRLASPLCWHRQHQHQLHRAHPVRPTTF
jgi:histone deacetylase 1/2